MPAMRIDTTTDHESVEQPRPKVWLTADEYQQLVRAADSYRDSIIIRLGGEVGLRSFEVPQVRPTGIRRHVGDDADHYFLRVPKGKDTTGNGGKARDAYLPRDLEREIHRYVRSEAIDDGEPIVDVSTRTVQRVVTRTADRAAEQTGDADFRKLSSHDLRRYFAHTALVSERMNPRVVMDVGGWSDYQSLEPYLAKPDPETIIGEFERAGLD